MQGEYETIMEEKMKQNSVKFQGNMLMAVINGIEFLNGKFDPFDIKLDGWSEQFDENMSDYDDIFGELYEKYKSKVDVPPEIKLISIFASSAITFHFTKVVIQKASSQVPEFDEVMRSNPNLKRQYEEAAKQTVMNKGQGTSLGNKVGGLFNNSKIGNFIGGLFGNNQQEQQPVGIPMNNQMKPPQQQQQQVLISPQPIQVSQLRQQSPIKQAPTSQLNSQVKKNEIKMDGPTGVEDVLNSLTKGTNRDLIGGEKKILDLDNDNNLSELGILNNKRKTKNF
jgi:hypothetical protein